MPLSRAGQSVDPPDIREWAIVALLTLLAFTLRMWHPGAIGLGQYDEGVYALSGLGVADGPGGVPLFRNQEKFSPPIFFSLIALAYRVGGVSDLSAVMVNVLIGTLTVPLMWMVARRWFSPATGVAAATLVAMSEAHITLSRSALTDVVFTFAFLLALAALVWAIENGGIARAVLAGLAVGLAWNTKYHGWFALVIVAGAIVGKWRFGSDDPGERRRWASAAIRTWAVASIVAFACYVPWMLFVQDQSTATLGWLAHYARFLRLNWVGNALEYAREQFALEGPVSRTSIPLAALFAALVLRPERGTPRAPAPLAMLLVSLGSVAIGGLGMALVLSVMTLVRVLREDRRLVAWVLLCWLGIWFVSAPLYEPYFRLLLPLAAPYVLAGRQREWISVPSAARDVRARQFIGVALAGVVLVCGLLIPRYTTPWRDARSFARAAGAIGDRVPPGAPVSVLGEPPLQFYLQTSGHPSLDDLTIAALDSGRLSGFLVTGRYVNRSRNLGAAVKRREPQLEVLDRFPITPTDLRLFDDTRMPRGRRFRQNPDAEFDLTFYRYTPARGEE